MAHEGGGTILVLGPNDPERLRVLRDLARQAIADAERMHALQLGDWRGTTIGDLREPLAGQAAARLVEVLPEVANTWPALVRAAGLGAWPLVAGQARRWRHAGTHRRIRLARWLVLAIDAILSRGKALDDATATMPATEACRRLGVAKQRLAEIRKRGDLHGVLRGREYFYVPHEVEVVQARMRGKETRARDRAAMSSEACRTLDAIGEALRTNGRANPVKPGPR